MVAALAVAAAKLLQIKIKAFRQTNLRKTITTTPHLNFNTNSHTLSF